jgi:hypothetical protein
VQAPAPAPAPVPPAPAAAHTAPRPRTKKERRSEKTAAAAAAEAADDALLEAAIAEARLAASAEPSPSSDDADDAGEFGFLEEFMTELLEQLDIPTNHFRPLTATENTLIESAVAAVLRSGLLAPDSGLLAPRPHPQPAGASGPVPSSSDGAPSIPDVHPAGSIGDLVAKKVAATRPEILEAFSRYMRDLLRRGGDDEDSE